MGGTRLQQICAVGLSWSQFTVDTQSAGAAAHCVQALQAQEACGDRSSPDMELSVLNLRGSSLEWLYSMPPSLELNSRSVAWKLAGVFEHRDIAAVTSMR